MNMEAPMNEHLYILHVSSKLRVAVTELFFTFLFARVFAIQPPFVTVGGVGQTHLSADSNLDRPRSGYQNTPPPETCARTYFSVARGHQN